MILQLQMFKNSGEKKELLPKVKINSRVKKKKKKVTNLIQQKFTSEKLVPVKLFIFICSDFNQLVQLIFSYMIFSIISIMFLQELF